MKKYYVLFKNPILKEIVELKNERFNKFHVKDFIEFYKKCNKREKYNGFHWPLLILNIDPIIAISTDL